MARSKSSSDPKSIEQVLMFDQRPVIYGLIFIALIVLFVLIVFWLGLIEIPQFKFIGNYSIGVVPTS